MKLGEYIVKLTRIAKEHGDQLEVIYSADDEGNRYDAIHFHPSPCNWDGTDLDPGAAMSQEGFNAVLIN